VDLHTLGNTRRHLVFVTMAFQQDDAEMEQSVGHGVPSAGPITSGGMGSNVNPVPSGIGMSGPNPRGGVGLTEYEYIDEGTGDNQDTLSYGTGVDELRTGSPRRSYRDALLKPLESSGAPGLDMPGGRTGGGPNPALGGP
jgi:hypothetical protein